MQGIVSDFSLSNPFVTEFTFNIYMYLFICYTTTKCSTYNTFAVLNVIELLNKLNVCVV